jgi:hypothetical protein
MYSSQPYATGAHSIHSLMLVVHYKATTSNVVLVETVQVEGYQCYFGVAILW